MQKSSNCDAVERRRPRVLPDGTWKRISQMTDLEKELAHFP
jgi:hypothetical protein